MAKAFSSSQRLIVFASKSFILIKISDSSELRAGSIKPELAKQKAETEEIEQKLKAVHEAELSQKSVEAKKQENALQTAALQTVAKFDRQKAENDELMTKIRKLKLAGTARNALASAEATASVPVATETTPLTESCG